MKKLKARFGGWILCGMVLLSGGAALPAQTVLVNEQFLDQSLANGSAAGEIDLAWYFVNSGSGGTGYTLIVDNTSPLSDRVMRNPKGAANNTMAYAALPAAVTLARPGDYIRVEFDGREADTATAALLIGILNDNGTPIVANQFGVAGGGATADDGGYFCSKYTAATTATVKRQPFSGGAVAGLGTLNGPFPQETDNVPHHIAMTVTRLADNRLEIEVKYRLAAASGSTPEQWVSSVVNDAAPVSYEFNEIALQGTQIDFRWDNIVVTTGNRFVTLLEDHFLDGTTARTGAAGEVDAAWYCVNAAATGAPYTVVTDNTAPLSGSVLRNPNGNAANSAAYASLPGGGVNLAKAGDYVRLDFDERAAANANKELFFGLMNANGTPLTANQFGVSPNAVADDGGYYVKKYSGATTAAASRQELDGGGSAALGSAAGSLPEEADMLPHHVALIVTRLPGSQVQVQVCYDQAAPLIFVDTLASNFFFDEVYLNASQLDFRWDNITVTTGNALAATTWAEWGPGWSRAGLGVTHFNGEGQMAPQPGDIDFNEANGRGMIEWRAVTAPPEGTVNFLDATLFPRVAESLTPYTYSGMVEYLHVYLKGSDTATTTAVLAASSIPGAADYWLNGAPVVPGGTLVLAPGWNRFLVKSRSPSTISGFSWSTWNSRVSFTNATGDLQFSTVDPERKVLVTEDLQPFRFLSHVGRNDESTDDFPLFPLSGASTTNVDLQYSLQVGVGTDSATYQPPASRTSTYRGPMWVYSVDPASSSPFNSAWTMAASDMWQNWAPAQAHLRVFNDQGTPVSDQTLSLSYSAPSGGLVTAAATVSFTSLQAGNYVIFSDLLDGSGKVLARDTVHSFAVLAFTPNPSLDQQPRLLGVAGHWFTTHAANDMMAKRMRWLQRVGMPQEQKLQTAWSGWGASHDGHGTVTVAGSTLIDTALTDAAASGVTVTGDVDEGLYSASLGNLSPAGASAFPAYGTTAWDQTLFQYGQKMAAFYQGRVQAWCGTNEIAATGTTDAQMFVRAATQIKAGIKAVDPTIPYISSSLTGLSTSSALFSNGFLDVADIIDVHEHPYATSEPGATSLSGTTSSGRGMLLLNAGYTKPLIYGELSSPRCNNLYGAAGQAGDMVKQTAWAVNWRDASVAPVKRLSYLVAYEGPDYTSDLGFDTHDGDPLPVVNAANVASTLLDGRTKLPALSAASLTPDASHIHVTSADPAYPETIVLWRTGAPTQVTVSLTSATVKVTDLMGRTHIYPVTGGKFPLLIGSTPVYLSGTFAP